MGPQVYELRVRGPVPASVLDEIGALDVGEEPALTVLRTAPTDQSGLHGMLLRLRSLGLELLEVRSASEFAWDDDEGDWPAVGPVPGPAAVPAADDAAEGGSRP